MIIRRSLAEIKEEMCNQYSETQTEDFSVKVFTLMLNPKAVQSDNWKSYWQDQIKMLTEDRSSVHKTIV